MLEASFRVSLTSLASFGFGWVLHPRSRRSVGQRAASRSLYGMSEPEKGQPAAEVFGARQKEQTPSRGPSRENGEAGPSTSTETPSRRTSWENLEAGPSTAAELLNVGASIAFRSPSSKRPPGDYSDLEFLFNELDADGSGQISRAELEYAIIKVYGEPGLDPKIIDEMMYDADTDGDGEISLTEFKKMMAVAKRERGRRRSKEFGAARSMWRKVKDKGPSRLVKASEQMSARRNQTWKQRLKKIDQTLDDIYTSHPHFWKKATSLRDPKPLPPPPSQAPAALPGGGGLPPKKQQQLKTSLFWSKSARRSSRKKKKDVDLEAGLGAKDAEEQLSWSAWLLQFWQSLSMSCLVSWAVETVDLAVSIGPLVIALMLPISWVVDAIRDQINAYLTEPGYVAPPPPPSQPDLSGKMHELELSFYDFAQEEPVAYLVADLGLGFAVGALALFWKDITDWIERRQLAASRASAEGGFQKLEEEEEKDELSPAEMRKQLNIAITTIEQVIQLSYRTRST